MFLDFIFLYTVIILTQDWIKYQVKEIIDWHHNNHAAKIKAEEIIEEGHECNGNVHTLDCLIPTEKTRNIGIDDIVIVKVQKQGDE